MEKRKRSPVERGIRPVHGQQVRYVMEDGETVEGRVIGIDDYENTMIVTVERENGSLYGAKFKKKKA